MAACRPRSGAAPTPAAWRAGCAATCAATSPSRPGPAGDPGRAASGGGLELKELAQRTAYALLWVSCNALFRVFFRYRAHNAPRLRGAFVLVANHSSFIDPLLLGAGLRRRLIFMMTDVYYRSPRTRWFYRFFSAIPVAVRGGNREALRAARQTLDRGKVLMVFPEGGLSRDGLPFLGSPGAVALVLAKDVPVVPAAIVGAFDALPVHRTLPRPRRITVRFGDPIPAAVLADPNASRKERLTQATDRIMRAIAELHGVQAREDELRALRRPPPA